MNKSTISDKTELGFKELKRLREKRRQGSVTFHVNKDGRVEKIKVETYH